MLFPMHMTLISLGVLFLLTQNFVWNFSLLTLGIIVSVMAFFSVFFDPSLLIFP